MTREEIVALFEKYRHATLARDAAALASLHAETCVMESPTAGGAVTGRSAIAQIYETWFRGFPESDGQLRGASDRRGSRRAPN